jgi:peptidyl-tRNA hydrolase, PTH1 family
MKFLIAGLGNIGAEYELTRHNIGFMAADFLADGTGAVFSLQRLAYKTEFRHKGRILHVIKPSTYMNLSGKALLYWKNALDIPLEQVLVITDDVALPLGTLRMRAKGSDGGHNGLRSIAESFGSTDYPRLRMGIGDRFHKGGQVDYVLGKFGGEEMECLPEMLARTKEMVLSFCTQGITRTMSQFNG